MDQGDRQFWRLLVLAITAPVVALFFAFCVSAVAALFVLGLEPSPIGLRWPSAPTPGGEYFVPAMMAWSSLAWSAAIGLLGSVLWIWGWLGVRTRPKGSVPFITGRWLLAVWFLGLLSLFIWLCLNELQRLDVFVIGYY